MNTIQDYTLYWFISLYDYYLYTNDTEFFLKMYPSAKKLMEEFCFKSLTSAALWWRSRTTGCL